MSKRTSLAIQRALVLWTAAVFLVTLSASAQSASSWQLVWSDEFNGTAGSAPNSQYWTIQQGLTPDGAQSYNCLYGQTTSGCNPATPNVSLDGNGHLAIVAYGAAAAPNGVTSGRLMTTAGSNNQTILFGTQYGRIEASISLPAGTGNQGVWPAFWMLGNNISAINWPSCGEMDIMEYVGAANETQTYSTLHGQGYANMGLGVRATNSAGWSGFHTYGAIWSPNQISFYVDSIANIIGTISADDIMANQPWVNGGLAAWPFNNPAFIILNLNMGGPFPGNVSAATTYPQTMLVDYVRVYQATAPSAPTAVTATANSQSQVTLNWTASNDSDATYNVYRSQVSGFTPQSQAQPNGAVIPQTNQNLLANAITGTTYTDTNLSPGQTYYYIVTASGGYSGEAAASQVAVNTPASGVGSNGGTMYIGAAGYSGTGAYIRSSMVSGGFTNAFTNTAITSGISNPAPQDVYHSERWGPQTWTLAHLTPGGSYNVRMHFAESAWTAANQRQFNVLIDGEQVLTNFDIFATAGAQNKVITETINALADRNGVIYLQLTPGAYDQPEIRAIDVSPSTGGIAYGEAAGSTTYVAIDAGGVVEGAFEDDEDAGNFGLPSNAITAGGGTNTTTQTISTTGVTNPAPAAVYQTERYGQFGYFFTGLAANSNYTIRLHMAEGVTTYTTAGDRQFNVVVNGAQVLTNYDIFANAHAVDQAVIATLTGVSDEHGILSVQFVPGAADLPSIRGIDITQSSAPVAPSPASGLTASAASSSQINLAWTASATAGVTYEIFRSTVSGFTPSSANMVATSTGTTYANTGLTSATTYYYVVEATNTGGTSAATAQASATTLGSAPAPATALVATAVSASQINLNWTASTTAGVSYEVFGSTTSGFVPSSANLLTTTTATTYSNTGLAASTAYFYVVEATNTSGTSAATTQATATTSGSTTQTDVLDIDAGGAASGSYVADVDFAGGMTSSTTATISTTKVATPAPQAVYQSDRYGDFTYTLPNLTAGAAYTVNLHFAEIYWTAAAKREFNVLINGTQVLTNFDIFATAGGENIAIVESFPATASSTGAITVQFTTGAADLPKISGIEISKSGTVTAPAPATGLAATAISASQINLSWTASTTAGVSYEVFRSTTSGFTPSSSNLIATTTATSYSNTGLAASTTYYYAVEATNSTGTSAATAQVHATTSGSTTQTDVIDINAGGTATGSYIADADFVGGTASSTAATINTTKVANPAPQAVYQTERYGSFTYTIPNLTAGASYTVNLHLAETYWTAAAEREFNVLINGQQVLTNFDIFAAAGGENIAIVESFPATASSTGTITVQFTAGAADQPKVSGIEISKASLTDVVDIDSGGAASGSYIADANYVGGTASASTAAVNTAQVANPAPQAVYQTERYGNFTYTIPNLTAGASYTVMLHFAENYWTAAGQREFNVLINGAQVLTNFDILATAGGENIAIVKSFAATASSTGTITVQFTTGAADLAKISGIEIAH